MTHAPDPAPLDSIDQVLEEIHETAAEAFAARQHALDTEAADWLHILETERTREVGA